MVFPPGDSTMNFPTSTHVGRLYVESRHLPATQGGGGDIHDVMATPFGVRLLVGDVMGAGLLRSARLVTVTGPGGVGKTRVALRAAAQLSGEFADGTCLVELSGLHDPELLPDTIATCLGLPGTEPRSQLDAIIEHLRDQR